jgi:uncharacterized CHY-type Zn-finger protein
VTFDDTDIDGLECRVCSALIDLEAYRRFQLCPACEKRMKDRERLERFMRRVRGWQR